MKKTIHFITAIIILSATSNIVRAQSWNLLGNAGTNTTTDFIGTTDAKAFKIRTNNVVRMTITSAGKVGVGTASPVFKLDIKSGSINTDSLYRINGYPALSTKGFGNTFVGLNFNTANTGEQNTFAGNYSGVNNTSGGNNTFIGYSSGSANTTGTDNTFVGEYAGSANSTGSYNTVIGKAAGYFGGSYSYNTFLGYATGYANTGSGNTFTGYRSGQNNTSGYINTYYGAYSGYTNSTANANTGVGDSALVNNTAGGNTTLGSKSGLANTSGSNNTFIGNQAGYSNTTGSNNIYLGAFATGNTNALTNAIAIGTNAFVSASNSMVLGEGVNVGIGNHVPAVKLNVTGTNEVLRLDGTTPSLMWKDGATNTGFIQASGTDFMISTNQSTSNNLVLRAANSGNVVLRNGVDGLYVHNGGLVSIGTTNTALGYKLSVGGGIMCEVLRVELQANWPDYVFNENHNLLPIKELERQIKKDKHLPGIPTACELEEKGGLNVGEMQIKMMEKIEELTLYVIQLKKENNSLKESMDALKK